MLLQHHHSRVCRKSHSQAQRAFKTAPLYAVTNPQPTASGSMPVAAIYGTKHYAIQSDHLNTPRRLVQSDGQVAWQWAYSAFGDEQPTIANNRFANTALNQSFGTTTVPAVTFNLRYPGQYFDQESNLHYNYHRSYSATVGRYTQSDPIGLDGGWNRFGYVGGNPLSFTDPLGLQAYMCAAGLPAWCPPPPKPIPTPPPPKSKEDKCFDAWNMCMLMADYFEPLWNLSVGLTSGGVTSMVRSKSFGAGAGAVAGMSTPKPFGMDKDGIRKGCDAGYQKCKDLCK